jgi:hypothetical protein
MSAFSNGDWDRMGQIMTHFVNVAEAILRTRAGVAAYLQGKPYFRNTAQLNLPEGTAAGHVEGDWLFPYLQFPYLARALGLQDVDLCGPDLEYNVSEGAKSAMQWIRTIRNEPEDGEPPAPWITQTMTERNERTAPIAPELVPPESQWRRNMRQQQAYITAPDAAEAESQSAMETEETAAPADPLSLDAGASSTGSPIGGLIQPTEKIRTGVQLTATATADDDVTMNLPPAAVELETVEEQLFSNKMREHALELQRVTKQNSIAIENSSVASDDEGDETVPVNTELADKLEKIEED